MATLSDVVTSLKDINTTLEAPPKKSASDVEREMEAANDAKRGRKFKRIFCLSSKGVSVV